MFSIPFLAGTSLVALSLTPAARSAQDVPTAERVEAAARAGFEEQRLVGLAVAVVSEGRLAQTAFLGYEDREAQVPLGEDTLFRWASISKPLTAVVALQLAREERLDLDADVRRYVPEFPEKEHVIRPRQLLCHQGGIVHYSNGEVIRTQREYDVEHPYEDVVLALNTFKKSPLVAVPGERYAYTTHGYILLGAVVQRAGGASYWDQVRTRIAGPLKMQSLHPDYPWVELPHRAVGYRKIGVFIMRSTDTDVSWKLPGGGFVSTVGDLGRFAAGLLGDELLLAADKALAWSAQRDAAGEPTRYGLGFSVGRAWGSTLISHSGSQEKTRTLMRLFPERSCAVVLMTNSEYAQLRPVSERIEVVLKGLGDDE